VPAHPRAKRHPDFDAALIDTAKWGLLDPVWQGFVYPTHFGPRETLEPLSIGKTERRGKTQPISFNVANIRANQHAFGRWGYGLAYHLGDLSHAIFREPAYKKPDRKHARWAEHLFRQLDPPRLRQPVFVTLVSWHDGMRGPSGLVGSVPAVEKELIALPCPAAPRAAAC
jgi:hypothetical protein